jgi:hypothetical protein
MTIEEEKNEEIEAPLGMPPAEATVESVQPDNPDITSPPADDKRTKMKVAADAPWSERMWEVFTTFWPLGFVAFGGPQVRFLFVWFQRRATRYPSHPTALIFTAPTPMTC